MAVIGDLKPYFGEFGRLLRSIDKTLCRTGGLTASVTVINTATDPVNVTIVNSNPPITQGTSAGTAGPIPAGFTSISIVKTSSNADTVVLTLSDASTYTMTEQGEVFVDSATSGQLLPTYAISGTGTFKWHGIN